MYAVVPPLVPFDGSPLAVPPRTSGEKWERHFKGKYSQQLPLLFLPSTSNYVGSRGFIDRACQCLAPHCTELDWIGNPKECEGNGVFQGATKISIKHITDGTSSTFLFVERDSFFLPPPPVRARDH